MAHHASRSVYDRLTDRLNRCPQGAPPAESLFQILRILSSEREAELVSVLPIRPFTAARAAAIWKTSEAEARKEREREWTGLARVAFARLAEAQRDYDAACGSGAVVVAGG